MLTSPVSTTESFVVLVSSRGEDHDSLRGVFQGSRWSLLGAWNGSDGLRIIGPDGCGIAAVICGYGSPDCDWKLVVQELDKMAGPPKLIVSYWQANERLLAEVHNYGGYDLLPGAPFEPREALSMTERAWFARTSAAKQGRRPRTGVRCARPGGRKAVGTAGVSE